MGGNKARQLPPRLASWGIIERANEKAGSVPLLDAMLKRRWSMLRADPEYQRDYTRLLRQHPSLEEYFWMIRGSQPANVLTAFALAETLRRESAFDSMLALLQKYGLREWLPDPRRSDHHPAQLRAAFEGSGVPRTPKQATVEDAQVHWRTFTGATDPGETRTRSRRDLPVVLADGTAVFTLANDAVWIPVTEWDTKATRQAKAQLARRQIASETGYRRKPRRTTPDASKRHRRLVDHPIQFKDGLVRVPIRVSETLATIAGKMTLAQRIVATETGYRRPPRVSPRERAQAQSLRGKGKSYAEIARALGFDRIEDLPRSAVDALTEWYVAQGYSRSAARERAIQETTPPPASPSAARRARSQDRSRVRRRLRPAY